MRAKLNVFQGLIVAALAVAMLASGAVAQSGTLPPTLTPKPAPTPRINGARVFGVRPGNPFLFRVPVTGLRPMTFSAVGLPSGLTLDAANGIITGRTDAIGDHRVAITASNRSGSATAVLLLSVGPRLCLTPPMGWSSWNCFGRQVNRDKIRAIAQALIDTGLADHGYAYINIDDGWEGGRDAEGNLQAHAGMGDMADLAAGLHRNGLKLGIYSSPGTLTCERFAGSYGHEAQDVATFASWGVDYLKYDWCSYQQIQKIILIDRCAALLKPDRAAEARRLVRESFVLDVLRAPPGHMPASRAVQELEKHLAGLASAEELRALIAANAGLEGEAVVPRIKTVRERLGALMAEARRRDAGAVAAIEADIPKEPFRIMGRLLAGSGRDIIFSINSWARDPSRDPVWSWAPAFGCHLWRTGGDMGAKWKDIERVGFSQMGLEKWAGPGHWNDPDMLQVGNGSLSPEENIAHMTLWCLLSAPLIIGCDLTRASPFILSVLGNDEVIAVNQDPLGRQGARVHQDGDAELWSKPLADGDLAVALFNRGAAPVRIAASWKHLGISGKQVVRDLWRQKDLGTFDGQFDSAVPPRGVVLVKISPVVR